ncbi:Cyclopropane fatty-acyl-phospholipid synthase [Parelusimicrobium proximum]|uniref:SAM-dependent methyltransferase n=1 Tax=Parelusimicrobium proximum TaxID=3228953 RepID=UPI003D16F86F
MEFFKDKDTNTKFMRENMMGPDCIMLTEELTAKMSLNKNMRILDLGPGTGLSSIFLAKKTGAQIFAADLWIDPSDNYERFKQLGLENQIIPLRTDAQNTLPFAHGYFDAVISIDSYHYFGSGEEYLDKNIIPFVKKGGIIAIAVPGLKKELENGIPEEMKPYLQEDMNFHSVKWWKELWEKSAGADVTDAFSLDSHTKAWEEWLKSSNPYAVRDRDMMKAEDGKYYDTIGLIAKVK